VLLQSLGVQFQNETNLPASGIAVVGSDAKISDTQLESFARGGGKVLFLARRNATGAAGLQLQEKPTSLVHCSLPIGEARGLLHPTCAGAM
jgi:hypothetical protein